MKTRTRIRSALAALTRRISGEATTLLITSPAGSFHFESSPAGMIEIGSALRGGWAEGLAWFLLGLKDGSSGSSSGPGSTSGSTSGSPPPAHDPGAQASGEGQPGNPPDHSATEAHSTPGPDPEFFAHMLSSLRSVTERLSVQQISVLRDRLIAEIESRITAQPAGRFS